MHACNELRILQKAIVNQDIDIKLQEKYMIIY